MYTKSSTFNVQLQVKTYTHSLAYLNSRTSQMWLARLCIRGIFELSAAAWVLVVLLEQLILGSHCVYDTHLYKGYFCKYSTGSEVYEIDTPWLYSQKFSRSAQIFLDNSTVSVFDLFATFPGPHARSTIDILTHHSALSVHKRKYFT